MDSCTPFPWGTVQGSKVLVIGRRLQVLLLGGVLVLAPSTLGVVYTTDHEVVPRPCEICDWLLNSSHDHFGLQEGFFWSK
jgi:hypothetical protein